MNRKVDWLVVACGVLLGSILGSRKKRQRAHCYAKKEYKAVFVSLLDEVLQSIVFSRYPLLLFSPRILFLQVFFNGTQDRNKDGSFLKDLFCYENKRPFSEIASQSHPEINCATGTPFLHRGCPTPLGRQKSQHNDRGVRVVTRSEGCPGAAVVCYHHHHHLSLA